MSKIDAARKRLSRRNTGVIEAEKALDEAIRLREQAEQALYAAEEADTKPECCAVCP